MKIAMEQNSLSRDFFIHFSGLPAEKQRGVISGLAAVAGVPRNPRQTLRNKIIATVGHSPVWLGDIVRLCGQPRRSNADRWRSVRLELRRLIARGLIVRVGHWQYVAGDGLTKERIAN